MVRWFVRRKSDNAILGGNGQWYHCFACADDIKFYTSAGRLESAMRRRRVAAYRGFAVYPGECVDIVGNIRKGDNEVMGVADSRFV